ncbi:hypothetical protein RhiirA5_42892 [Rhizophagus irregularis]|uniref:Uncharacterized protein n=1 Tax=Rhizophagus irregularis TaxID=588596 RepID=A0A2N0P5F3_9GLOM|nr:hypothetical protein RhiirA5_42892 [Rhizophagus irregularis]GET50384.1 hypothetical protein RIR_jg33079.t1 [Rhizophagus irregularis DAOM 181602=DAOM 197198]
MWELLIVGREVVRVHIGIREQILSIVLPIWKFVQYVHCFFLIYCGTIENLISIFLTNSEICYKRSTKSVFTNMEYKTRINFFTGKP